MPSSTAPSDFSITTSIPSLTGKTIFITGGTAGLGLESIKYLAAASPAQIYFTGRNAAAAQKLISSIQSTYPSVSLTFVEMDMSSLTSIAESMRKITTGPTAMKRVDIVIASAGVMAIPGLKPYTKDDFEVHFGINHLGTALVIRHLLPVLQSTARLPGADVRVVILTSTAWELVAKMDIDLDGKRKSPSQQAASDGGIGDLFNMKRDVHQYGQSKLANILYAKELSARYESQGITTVAVHPGVVSTGLVSGLSWSWALLVKSTNLRTTVTPEEGVRNQLWAAVGSGVESGKWYLPVGVVGQEEGTKAADVALRSRLWEWTEDVFREKNVL